ncbi:flagellar biosynthetic protein FliO [Aliikangiella coralliicola]|nr:flagellar biosynthetic protein FliO [Aliikangiella coralliicola]
MKKILNQQVLLIICLSFALPVQAADKSTSNAVTPVESLLPMLMGLGGILLVIFILAFLLKKFNSFNMVSNHIRVIDSQNLGTKEKLVIVDIQGEQYVLGVTPNNINQICQLEQPIEKKPAKISFDKLMKQLLHPHTLVGSAKNDTTKNQSASEAS